MEDLRLAEKVLNLSGKGLGLRDDTILVRLALSSEMRHRLLDILLLVFGNLSVVTAILDFEELVRVHTLLDHVRDFFETLECEVWAVQDHMLKHFL